MSWRLISNRYTMAPMLRASFSSLRLRLVFLVLLAVVPALGLMLYTNLEQRRLATVQAQQDAQRLARLAATQQQQLIEGARQLLIALAQLPEMHGNNSATCNPLMVTLLKQYPLYANLGAIELDGEVFCSAIPLTNTVNVADRLYFRHALETGDFSVGDYQIGRVTGKATVNFGYPVLDQAGQPEAVAFVALDLAWLNRLASEAQLPTDSVFVVVDRLGTILARYPDPEQWVGQALPEAPVFKTILANPNSSTADVVGVDGIERLYAFAPLNSSAQSGVYVSIGLSKAVTFAGADRLLARNLAGLGVAGVLALAVAWFAGEIFVLRRINVLLRVTKRLSAGDLTARTGMPHGAGEIYQLAQAFDEMALALEQREAERQRTEVELQRAKDAAEAANRAKSTFLSGMSHELRTPLNHIIGYSEMLQEDAQEHGDIHLIADLKKIRTAGSNLLVLISDILELAKIEAGRVEFRPETFDIPTLVDEVVVTNARSMIEKNGNRLEVRCPQDVGQMRTDATKLRQSLINVLSNAAKFTENGTITLEVRRKTDDGGRTTEEFLPPSTVLRHPSSEDWITFRISDTGIGIAPEKMQMLFKEFTQVDASTTRQYGGTGLGLAITRRFCEMMGGDISVESEEGLGSTFTIRVPAQTAERTTRPMFQTN